MLHYAIKQLIKFSTPFSLFSRLNCFQVQIFRGTLFAAYLIRKTCAFYEIVNPKTCTESEVFFYDELLSVNQINSININVNDIDAKRMNIKKTHYPI